MSFSRQFGDDWNSDPLGLDRGVEFLGRPLPPILRPGFTCQLPNQTNFVDAGPLSDIPITTGDLERLTGQATQPGTQKKIFEALIAASGGLLWFHEISRSGLRLSHFLAQCCIESQGFTKLEEGFIFTKLDRLKEIHGKHLTQEEAEGFVAVPRKERHEAIQKELGVPKTPEEIKALAKALAESDAAEAKKPKELANTVYANRMGNGGVASGDGWNYRGRGLIQLTGRENYRAAGKALELPLESQPTKVAEPDTALRTAVWYWEKNGLNAHADLDDALKVSQAINLGAGAVGGKRVPNHWSERKEKTDEAKAVWGTSPPR